MAANTLNNPALFIVEDDEAWAASLSGKLGKKYDISTYASGEAALEELTSKKPAIIVLDYHLEGELTGGDTLKEIKKLLPDTTVIMFSAQDDVQVALDILQNGAYDYVVKGENAMNRLKIILRNIEERDSLRKQMVELKISVRREKLAIYLVTAFIIIGSILIYLNTCPEGRPIKWDPFGKANSAECGVGIMRNTPDIPFKSN
jgi:DNA-binding NtrC family response regulator